MNVAAIFTEELISFFLCKNSIIFIEDNHVPVRGEDVQFQAFGFLL